MFDAVVEPENLRLAFWKASRGKQHRPDQRAYAARLEEEIEGLRLGLLQGDYPVGEYTRFRVYDPKERVICAAAFRERVLHHALINVCEPLVDAWLVFDCYACRVGKGQARAVRRAQAFAGQHGQPYTSPVRSFEANGYGLYDMAGNVWELCFCRSSEEGLPRVIHGGRWGLPANFCRVVNGSVVQPNLANDDVGLRAVLPAQ